MEPPEYAGSRLAIRCMEQTSGRSPAREFLQALPDRERLRVTLIIKQLGDRGFLAKRTDIKRAIRMRAEFNERTRER